MNTNQSSTGSRSPPRRTDRSGLGCDLNREHGADDHPSPARAGYAGRTGHALLACLCAGGSSGGIVGGDLGMAYREAIARLGPGAARLLGRGGIPQPPRKGERSLVELGAAGLLGGSVSGF